MKKSGFTLAEVLITLAIIGVVATLTLPALMTNTGEQQYKTGLKKGINTLTEAGQMSSAMAGFDYASLTTTSTAANPGAMTAGESEQSLYALLSNRANIDYSLSGKSSLPGDNASNIAIFFRDGMAISYNPQNAVVSNESVKTFDDGDGIIHGIPITLDVNGAKGPNLHSNCQANSAAANALEADNGVATTSCTKDKRVIKDRFAVRLRGVYAVPNNAAARWVFDN